mmetsp:Transcript_30532/g.37611  ORF Transcript_30532/g.37611 Transcript_30532/m.37611 type:complete len:82 (+) Transcript_30532:1716-1961(+)
MGYKGDLATKKSQVSSSEATNLSKNTLLRRTDTGHVRMKRSVGRQQDSLIRDTQRFKNICSENEKLDYMTQNFCITKMKKR